MRPEPEPATPAEPRVDRICAGVIIIGEIEMISRLEDFADWVP